MGIWSKFCWLDGLPDANLLRISEEMLGAETLQSSRNFASRPVIFHHRRIFFKHPFLPCSDRVKHLPQHEVSDRATWRNLVAFCTLDLTLKTHLLAHYSQLFWYLKRTRREAHIASEEVRQGNKGEQMTFDGQGRTHVEAEPRRDGITEPLPTFQQQPADEKRSRNPDARQTPSLARPRLTRGRERFRDARRLSGIIFGTLLIVSVSAASTLSNVIAYAKRRHCDKEMYSIILGLQVTTK